MTIATPVVLGSAVLSNGSLAVLGGNYVQLTHNGCSYYSGFDQLQVAILSNDTPTALNQTTGLLFPAGENPNNGGWNPTYGGGTIAALPTGGMVLVTWGGTNLHYEMQILDNSGAVTTAPFVIANQYTTAGNNDFYGSNPLARVATLSDGTNGGIVVSWQNDDDQIMYMQRYTLAGVADGSRVTVASNYSGSDEWYGSMAVDSSGNVIFGFGASDIYTSGTYKEFNSANSVVGSGNAGGNEYAPKCAALPGGGFVTISYAPTGSYSGSTGTWTNFTMNIQEISASGGITTLYSLPNAVAPDSRMTASINWIVVLPDGTVEFQEDTDGGTSTTADLYNISTNTLSRNTITIGTLPFATSPSTGTGNSAVGVGVNGSNQLVGEGVSTNQAPVATTSGGVTAAIEQTSIAVDTGITLSDADNATLSSATVNVAANFQAGEDVLAFTNTSAVTYGNIAASYTSATGVLTLTSAGATATVAQWQAALRAVTYADISDAPNTATRTIGFAVNDGTASSPAASKSVSITAVNDAPVLGGAGNSVSFTENGAAVALNAALTVSDADSANLAGATVTISSGLLAGDTLNFVSQNGITSSYNSATGVLTLSGSATVANYRTALQSITFSSSSDNPTNSGADTSRTITWQVNDGSGSNNLSNLPTTTVNVTAVNDAPVLSGGANSVGFTENGTAVLDSALTISDADSAGLTGATVSISAGFLSGDALNFVNQNGITSSYNSATGVLTLSGSASIANYQTALESVTFSSSSDNPDNFGADTSRMIVWQVNDGSGSNNLSNQPSTTVNITSVNDAPVLGGAANSAGFTENGAAVAVDSGLTISDADSATLSGATVSISAGLFSGDTLNFVNQNGITGSYDSATGVLSLSGSASTADYQVALRSVSFSSSSENPDNYGADASRTITWRVNDGSGSSNLSNQPTSTVDVTAIDDPGEAKDDVFTIAEDAGLSSVDIFADNGSGPDTDVDNSPLTVTSVTPGTAGLIYSLSTDGKFSFDPSHAYDYLAAPGSGASNLTATVTFTYTIDGGTAPSETATITVTITGVDSDDLLIGTTNADTLSPGIGNDTVNALAGDDIIAMGAGLSAGDSIDGGGGNDTLTLSGDYVSTPVVFSPTTMVNIENLAFAAGSSYDITTSDATVAAGQVFNVNATALGASDSLIFDGSAETDGTFAFNGGDGNDTLTGGAGNDTFHPHRGADSIRALGGDDSIVMGGDLGAADAIDGGDGNDTVALSGDYATTPLVLSSTTMVNVENLVLGTGNSYDITTSDATVGAGQTLAVNGWTLGAGDSLTFDGSAETDGSFDIRGGFGSDSLAGGAGDDSFHPRQGTDIVSALGGDDTIAMGGDFDAADSIDGGDGNDTVALSGDYATTPLVLSSTTMVNVENLVLGTGNSYSITTSDAAVAAGQSLAVNGWTLDAGDVLIFDGSAESDGSFDIRGGFGNDTLTGGAGNDTFHPRQGIDTVRALGGDDTIAMSSDFNPGDSIDGGDGNDTVTLSGDYAATPLVLSPTTMVNVESLTLGTGNSYTITTSDPTVAAGQTLAVSGWTLGASDTLIFDGSAETDGSFAIRGGLGNDTLTGGAGNDIFQPRQGFDTVRAMGGDDTISMSADLNAADAIDGGDGNDTVKLNGDYATTPLIFSTTTMVNVENLTLSAGNSYNLTTSDATVGAGQTLIVAAGTLGASDVLNFEGSAETDGSFAITGGAGNDSIAGGAGADSFSLLKGGSDTVIGGAGNDTIKLGATLNYADKIDGGAGTDTVNLSGDYSAGVAIGVTTMLNVEKLVVSAGYNYKLTTNDAVVASGQTLTVSGSALGSSNWLYFSGAAETDGTFSITGGAGNDTLYGGAGADTISGGNGSNRIRGGGGADALKGGSGADTFVFAGASDSSSTAYDTITGFDAASDKIDLWFKPSQINTWLKKGALSASGFDNSLQADLSGHLTAGGAILFTPNSGTMSGKVFLVVDCDGDGVYTAGSDLVVRLTSTANLASLSLATFT